MFLWHRKLRKVFHVVAKKKRWWCSAWPEPVHYSLLHTTHRTPWIVEMVGQSVPLSGASNLGGHWPHIPTAHTHYLPAGTHATNQETSAVWEMKRGANRLGPVSCGVSPWWEVSLTTSASGGPCSHGFFCQLERPYICPRSNQVAHPPILLMLLHLFYEKT